eukprot:SAG22_NODE_2366_length_2654_cov_2.044227_2_plen_132_part_00
MTCATGIHVSAQLDFALPDWFWPVAIGGDVFLWLLVYVVKSKLKKPFIHVGVTPGGSSRGQGNRYGGSSPFFIRMRSSVFPPNFDKLKVSQSCTKRPIIMHQVLMRHRGVAREYNWRTDFDWCVKYFRSRT